MVNSDKSRKRRKASAAATRRQEPRSDAQRREGLSSGITIPGKSREPISDHQYASMDGTVAIDWLEAPACIKWDEATSKPWFEKLKRSKGAAQEQGKPVVLTIGDDIVTVARMGSGRGKESYKDYLLWWNGIKIQLSPRQAEIRQQSNAKLEMPGTACLITGAGRGWDFFRRLIKKMGGRVTDQWIRRLDICIDLPGVEFQPIYDLLQAKQFSAKCKGERYEEDGHKLKQFAIGKSNRLRVSIYDKLLEMTGKHAADEAEALIDRRWNGVIPSHAIRVEFQIGREWFAQFNLKNAEDILKALPRVFAKITGDGGGFRMITDDKRPGKPASTHPFWKRVVEIGQAKIGKSTERLKRLKHSNFNESYALAQAIGVLLSINCRRRYYTASIQDLVDGLQELLRAHDLDDQFIAERFELKAKEKGAWQEIMGFTEPEEDDLKDAA